MELMSLLAKDSITAQSHVFSFILQGRFFKPAMISCFISNLVWFTFIYLIVTVLVSKAR